MLKTNKLKKRKDIIKPCLHHSLFCFLTVTKQRDPESGQQSLLFQVSVFDLFF